MATEDFELTGKYVRLEPLGHRHVEGFVKAAAEDPSLYRWSPIPQGRAEAVKYVIEKMPEAFDKLEAM